MTTRATNDAAVNPANNRPVRPVACTAGRAMTTEPATASARAINVRRPIRSPRTRGATTAMPTGARYTMRITVPARPCTLGLRELYCSDWARNTAVIATAIADQWIGFYDRAMAFNHVALATRDLSATHAFYTDVMGFTLEKVVAAPTDHGWAKH